MIAVYVQDDDKAYCVWKYPYKGEDTTQAIKWGIENKKLAPGQLAMTIVLEDDGKFIKGKTIKHWAIYHRHGEIEAVPDRVGVPLKHNAYQFYRRYMKYGRIKSMWYKIWKINP